MKSKSISLGEDRVSLWETFDSTKELIIYEKLDPSIYSSISL